MVTTVHVKRLRLTLFYFNSHGFNLLKVKYVSIITNTRKRSSHHITNDETHCRRRSYSAALISAKFLGQWQVNKRYNSISPQHWLYVRVHAHDVSRDCLYHMGHLSLTARASGLKSLLVTGMRSVTTSMLTYVPTSVGRSKEWYQRCLRIL